MLERVGDTAVASRSHSGGPGDGASEGCCGGVVSCRIVELRMRGCRVAGPGRVGLRRRIRRELRRRGPSRQAPSQQCAVCSVQCAVCSVGDGGVTLSLGDNREVQIWRCKRAERAVAAVLRAE
jgi:hypothetical protein